MAQHAENTPSLPTNRAFVLQLRTEADVEQGRFVGRVEHVVSGQALQFQSLEELLTFIARMLNSEHDIPPEKP